MNNVIPSLKTIAFVLFIIAWGIWAGGCAPVNVRSLEQAGIEAYNASDYETALKKWQSGLEMARELEDTPYIGQFLYHIGLAYDKLDQYQDALAFAQQALDIYRQSGNAAKEANTLNNIGIIYDKLGRYREALSAYEQALEIRRARRDKQGEGNTLDNIGIIYYRQGEYQKTLNTYHQALSIRRAIGDQAGEGNTLNNIAAVYESRGQYQQALDAYQQALRIRQHLEDQTGKGQALNNIGVIFWKLGRYERALEYYQQALELKRDTNDTRGEATVLNNLGVTQWKLGDDQKALAYYDKALAIRQTIEDRLGEGSTLSSIGKVYEDRHEYQQALDYYRQALAIRHAIGDKRGEGSTLSDLGTIYHALGDYRQAYESFSNSTALNASLGTLDALWVAQCGLAAVEVPLGQTESAIGHYEQALDTIEQLRGELREKEDKMSFMQEKLYVYDELIDLLYDLHTQFPENGYDRRALEIFERKQGRVFLEEMGKSGARLFAGLPEDLVTKEYELEAHVEHLRDQLSNERSARMTQSRTELIRSLEQREQALKEEQSALQAQLKSDYPEYYALKYPHPVSLHDLQENILQTTEVMLVYNVMQEYTILWSICSASSLAEQSTLVMYALPIGEEDLQEKIVTLRDALSRDWLQQRARGMLVPLDAAFQQKSFVQASYELYVLLFPGPVRRLMTPERTAHIVPTGPLYAMPFESLVTALPHSLGEGRGESTAHYLIEDVPIRYLSSASLLKTLREAQARRKTTAPHPLLAFADPIYQARGSLSGSSSPDESDASTTPQTPRSRTFDTSTRGLFEALPETEAEVNAIKTLLKAPDESTPLQLREHASRTNVFAFNAEERLDDYRYVVFATHGVLPGQVSDLDQPALVLSHPEEDGFLTMADVFQLRFNADLISLSACNTGSGEQVRGEGVMGLTRAFMYAGTPTVAVTLWSVESFSAKALDVGLFEHLAAGQAPVEALRSIKLRMLRGEEGQDYTHPYYWAPFVLFGDGR